MAKIVINIDMDALSDGINQAVDDDFGNEFACPLSTHNKEVNEDHKQYAADEHSYGESKNKEKCGVCEYYNIKSEMIDCIEEGMGESMGIGYCEKLDFVCSADNWCDAFEAGGPITDFDDINELEPIEGGSKDIF